MSPKQTIVDEPSYGSDVDKVASVRRRYLWCAEQSNACGDVGRYTAASCLGHGKTTADPNTTHPPRQGHRRRQAGRHKRPVRAHSPRKNGNAGLCQRDAPTSVIAHSAAPAPAVVATDSSAPENVRTKSFVSKAMSRRRVSQQDARRRLMSVPRGCSHSARPTQLPHCSPVPTVAP